VIPTIETICEDLAAGKITVQQAIAWLHQHAEGAANDLRDHFAGIALPGLLVRSWEDASGKVPANVHELWANAAYKLADEMLKRRNGDSETAK
jgi:hypothetical protein